MKKILITLAIVVLAVVAWKLFSVVAHTAELYTYTNARQGFEIGVPTKSILTVGTDVAASKAENGDFIPSNFSATFETLETEVFIRKNFNSEITPPFLPGLYPGCRTETSIVVSNKYNLPATAYSSSRQADERSCGDDVNNAHTVFTRFCVGDSGNIYPSSPSTGGSEGAYECKGPFDPEYDINIFCHGPGWQRTAGRDKCISLYSKIIQSFKLY